MMIIKNNKETSMRLSLHMIKTLYICLNILKQIPLTASMYMYMYMYIQVHIERNKEIITSALLEGSLFFTLSPLSPYWHMIYSNTFLIKLKQHSIVYKQD